MMVWGMSFPSSFGDYWPLGQNEGDGKKPGTDGWFERLKEHFGNLSPEEQVKLFDYNDDQGNRTHLYAGYANGKFMREIGTRINTEYPLYGSIEPHEPPQFFQTERSYKTLGSLIALNSGLLAVDDTLKSIIEALEPAVHRFFPVEIRMPRGKIYPEQYYILVIGQYLESFSSEDSKENSWQRTELGNIRYTDSASGIRGLAFHESIFGNAHLWRERRINGMLTCFSDELVAEIEKASLRIPKHYQMKEV